MVRLNKDSEDSGEDDADTDPDDGAAAADDDDDDTAADEYADDNCMTADKITHSIFFFKFRAFNIQLTY